MRAWWSGRSRRRQVFLVMVAVVVLVVAGAVGVRLVGGGDSDATGTPSQSRQGPVLLVPGYGGDANSLSSLAAKLRRAGRVTDIVTLPGDGTGDLLAQVNALDDAVRQALNGGAPSVDVVGYSAGGVVTRLWVDRDAGQHRVRRVVTLGSPLHGTQLASAGSSLVPGACPLACQQLVPDSVLLREIDARQLPAGLPWLSLWTADDQTVTPPDSARLAGAVNVQLQDICPSVAVSHAQLPSSDLVDGIVLTALDGPALPTPTSSQCATLTAAGR